MGQEHADLTCANSIHFFLGGISAVALELAVYTSSDVRQAGFVTWI